MDKDKYRTEFSVMVKKLTEGDARGYDYLCCISDAFLKPFVSKLCSRISVLRDYDLRDDIYQDVLLALYQSCVSQFLYRNGVLNDDPDEFLSWIYTVAKNVTLSAARKYRAKNQAETSMVSPDGSERDYPDGRDEFASSESAEILRESFLIAASARSALHIVFVWMLRALILSGSIGIRQSANNKGRVTDAGINDYIAVEFSDDLLEAIYATIFMCSRKVGWMAFTESMNDNFLSRLSETDDGVRIGDRQLSDFYMKKGGSASVSDWINRMNARIRKKLAAKYDI